MTKKLGNIKWSFNRNLKGKEREKFILSIFMNSNLDVVMRKMNTYTENEIRIAIADRVRKEGEAHVAKMLEVGQNELADFIEGMPVRPEILHGIGYQEIKLYEPKSHGLPERKES